MTNFTRKQQPVSDPDIPNEDGYDNPRKEESSFNSVCISSLVFAFVGIGVLLSLATWSYISTMATLDDTRKADHTKLHSHKHKNISNHRNNGGMDDYVLKMGENSENTAAVSRSKFPLSHPYPLVHDRQSDRRANGTKFKLNILPADPDDGTHLEVSDEQPVYGKPSYGSRSQVVTDEPAYGKPIESISADEVRVMQERLIHKKWKMKRLPKEEMKYTTGKGSKPTPFPGLDPIQNLV